MARSGRFERPTLCFGGTRSIQLSYERAKEQLPIVTRNARVCVKGPERESALGALFDLPRQLFDFFGLLNQSEGERGGRIGFFDLFF
jgi:hypothetical protein